jgi:hypothetical protein
MPLTTPVAFIIFNRPDVTERVFQAIRQAQPKKLLVIADGPRADRPGEAEKCAVTRAIIDKVDWDCEVLTNYSKDNLGCGVRIYTGLDWVYSQVEEAIILEDDCLPSESFFEYCQTLLNHYRDDERVMQIGGNNFQNGIERTPYSYYFSRYNHSWGWASWRRAWGKFNFHIKTWKEFYDSNMMSSILEDPIEREYWSVIFNEIAAVPDLSVWDYQWTYACWSNHGLSIIPQKNLVSNLGFNESSTHTSNTSSPLANMQVDNIWEIKHPPFVARCQEADKYTFDEVFGGNNIRFSKTLVGKSKKVLSKIKILSKSAIFHKN